MDNNKSGGITITTPVAIVIAGAIIGIAVYASNGGGSTNTNTSAQNQPTSTTQQPVGNTQQVTEPAGPVTVSVDDDPFLGNPDAPVTMIDFSDYECPFCKRHVDQSFDQIKTEYIDTGKLKYVYRDLPLSFHDPLATQQAIAANCAREQGNDETYFAYHDEIFARTSSNGNGMPKDELYSIASDLGLDESSFKECLDSEKYKDEIQADIVDASAAGASATPTFFIGKSTDSGAIEGQQVVGAQPFSVIKSTIDSMLE